MVTAIRWSDNDRYYGPFTFSKQSATYRPIAFCLSSGGENSDGARLHMAGFGYTLIIALPQWVLHPHTIKINPVSWDAETIKRLGRDWYLEAHAREYGFTLHDGLLSICYGRTSNYSDEEKRWSKFLPWTQWRFVRHSFYGVDGKIVSTLPSKRQKTKEAALAQFRQKQAIEDATPTVAFLFDDFDGERITATTKIEEREWKFGEGWFKWLSFFRKSKISRSLGLHFSAETGKRKGSWKGGTIGHSIEMRKGELHQSAFQRYCTENSMKYAGTA